MSGRLPDLIGALVWLAAGAFLAIEGDDLGRGTMVEPGSGFILFWIGLAMIGLSLALGGLTLAEGGGASFRDLFNHVRWRSVFLVLLYLVLYSMVVEPVGFIITTVVLLILLFKTVEPQSWTTAIVGSLLTTAIVYVVFGIGLGTQFPNGIFGFR